MRALSVGVGPIEPMLGHRSGTFVCPSRMAVVVVVGTGRVRVF